MPIAAVIATTSTIFDPQTGFITVLTNTEMIALTVSASVVFVLGLFLLNPAFSDKSSNYVINLMIVMQGWSGLSLISLIGFRE